MSHVVVNAARPETREQRAWYWYDWANSAYVTTTATVLMSPYLTSVAEEAACPGLRRRAGLHDEPLGARDPRRAGVAVVLHRDLHDDPLRDRPHLHRRHRRPQPAADPPLRRRSRGPAPWPRASCSSSRARTGSSAPRSSSSPASASAPRSSIYDSILCRIANENERDRVSSKGWAFGYLGGGILLALNFALDFFHEDLGLDRALSTRISILSAGLWWAGFTIIPYLGLRHLTGTVETPVERSAGVVGGSIAQLRSTFRDLAHYPQTKMFLLAYLFFNDGIQTVIGSSSVYGSKELGFSETTVLGVFLFVQFVAFFGARLFGRVAASIGAWRTVLYGIGLWTVVVVFAFLVPSKSLVIFLALALLIGLVLGGTQALSRSLYSQLIPRGREAEYFSLYQAMERGTSWFGTLIFGLVYQFTLSYRWAIIALIVFFAIGGVLLSRVRMREGIEQAGNPVPAVI